MEKILPDLRQSAQISVLENDLRAIVNDPVMPVPGCGVMAFQDGKLLYEGCFGFRRVDAAHPENNLPFRTDTRFRTASISKVFSAVGVMQLVEQGTLDLDADVLVVPDADEKKGLDKVPEEEAEHHLVNHELEVAGADPLLVAGERDALVEAWKLLKLADLEVGAENPADD